MSATIRLVRPEDAEEIAAIYRPFVTDTPVSFESQAPDADEMRQRIGAILPSYPWLVCDLDGQLAGYAYASQHRPRYHYRWSVDVTVYIHEGFRRRRIGYALYASLLALLPIQGFVSAHAGITLPNDGSVGLHEAHGFRQIALYPAVGHKFGVWHSVGWWHRLLQDPPAEPSNPIDLHSAQADPRWLPAMAAGQVLDTQ